MVRIVKPEWCSHSGYPIFSIDVHPSGKRFATGGGDNKIKIWNTVPLENEEDEKNESVPKLLCAIEHHVGPVNCVRWSPKTGKYLASGSDDRTIMLFEMRGGVVSNLLGSDEKIVENWRNCGQFKGHIADIVDLCWSPDGTKIASASLDNFVIIWDVARKEQIIKLSGHGGWVKGVAWDPIGRFIATQSEDRSVIIWRTSDWTMESKIDAPFKKVGVVDTFFRRPSWSPGGEYLTCAHANNGGNPTANVLTRGTWETHCEFVGHRLPVVTTRFNSRVFQNDSDEYYFICAIGSQDQSVSVWTNKEKRPLLIAKSLFKQGILDLSWGQDGYTLYVCATDGGIALLLFQPEELGKVVPEEEFASALRKQYGETLNSPPVAVLAENPFQLDLEEEQNKKRAPILSKPSSIDMDKFSPIGTRNLGIKAPPTPVAPISQTVTRLANGKRRVTPMPITEEEPTEIALRVFSESSTSILEDKSVSLQATSSETTKIPQVQSTQISQTSEITTLDNQEPKEKRKHSPEHDGSIKKSKLQHKEKVKDKKKREIPKLAEKKKEVAPAKQQQQQLAVPSKTVANGPTSETPMKLSHKIYPSTLLSNVQPLSLEVNIHEESEEYVSSVVCYMGTKMHWEDRIRSRVTHLTGNINFIAIGTEDGEVFIYTLTGRHLLPCLMVTDSVISLECEGEFLLIVAAGGELRVLNLVNETCILDTSISSLLASGNTISRARILKDGMPLLTFSNNYTFVYNSNLKLWARIADTKYPNSEFSSILKLLGKGAPKGILSEAQVQSNLSVSALKGTSSQRTLDTIAHLENQVAAALILKSPEEYKYWLQIYVSRLATEAQESKLQEICNFLVGPPTQETSWEPYILNLSKRKLLSDLLPTIAANRALQRLVNQFKEALDEVNQHL